MGKFEKPWYKQTAKALRERNLLEARIKNAEIQIEQLKEDGEKITPSYRPSAGGTLHDGKALLVLERVETLERHVATLQKRVAMLNNALCALTDEERYLIELVFDLGVSGDTAAREMHLSKRSYYRKKDDTVRKIAEMLGFLR